MAGPVIALMRGNRRDYYAGRKEESKCQSAECYATGILMGFRWSKILERPAHLQVRLDPTQSQEADDLLSRRLTTKRRCKAEMDDRTLAASVTEQYPATPHCAQKPDDPPVMKSSPSTAIDSAMPSLKQDVLSGEEAERVPPPPTPPICETVTWEEPPPLSTVLRPAKDEMHLQALNLIQRVPSRRGSWVDSALPQPIEKDTTLCGVLPMQLSSLRANEVFAPPVVRRNDTAGLDLPQIGTRRTLTHVTHSTTTIMDSINASLYPGFPRKRFAPPRHQVATEEIDR